MAIRPYGHTEPDQAEYDAARTVWLEARGYPVLRFENAAVHQNLEAVLEALKQACAGGGLSE